METTPCLPCCSEPQVVNVPGPEGAPGSSGISPPPPPPPEAGFNAFSFTAADFIVPAIGANVAVGFDLSFSGTKWMVEGQVVVFDGPATFQLVSKSDDFNGVFKFLGYALDVAAGSTVSAGAEVSPSGTQPPLTQLNVIAAGTAYTLTATAALLDFGTTDPSLIITTPGTWLITARARFDYVGATFADERTVTLKLRRTNNAPADIANSSAVFATSIITTQTHPAWDLQTPPVIYTTLNSDDILQLWADVSVLPTAGTLDCTAAQIIAIKLS